MKKTVSLAISPVMPFDTNFSDRIFSLEIAGTACAIYTNHGGVQIH